MNELLQRFVGEIIVPLLALWIVGLGVCYMIGKHGKYASFSKRIFINPPARLLLAFWNRNRKTILLIALGVAIGLWIANRITALSL